MVDSDSSDSFLIFKFTAFIIWTKSKWTINIYDWLKVVVLESIQIIWNCSWNNENSDKLTWKILQTNHYLGARKTRRSVRIAPGEGGAARGGAAAGEEGLAAADTGRQGGG